MNPYTMFEIIIDEKCTGCGKCKAVCPKGPRVFEIMDDKAVIKDVGSCLNCASCQAFCPVGAIKIKW